MSAPTIASLRTGRRVLEITWDDGVVTEYPWIWLRDHAHDADTLHPVTQQRQLYTAAVPADLRGRSAAIDGSAVRVVWSDAEDSLLPLTFLAEFRIAEQARATRREGITLWDAAAIGETPPTVDYEAVMTTEDGVADWLALTAEYGWCLAVGTPPTSEASEALLRRIGYVRETIFGGFWDFTADLAKADTAYTTLELRPHTDGTYSHDAPGVQLLHCLQFDGSGGESTIVDGFRIAETLARDAPAHHATLSEVVVPGQYIGDGSHLLAARPVLRHDHTGTLVQVSFNNYDRAPFLLPADEMIAFYDALRAFELLANDPANQWRHVLAPGEAMLFDNWRVLHGRAAYSGVRRMCGGYVNHEDVESRRRVAAATSAAPEFAG